MSRLEKKKTAPPEGPLPALYAGPWPSFGAEIRAKLMIIAAFWVGLQACKFVDLSHWTALFLFLGASALLYFSVPPDLRSRVGAVAGPPSPMERWEPYFAAALAVGAFLVLHWRYGSLPEGGIYAEGSLVSHARTMWSSASYQAVDPTLNGWPTLYHYQGMLFAHFLGWEPVSFRLLSLFYAMLLIFTVWLSVRSLSSPVTAAAVAMLYVGFHYNIHFARRYSPVLFSSLPAVLSLGVGIAALRRRSLPLAVLSGAAAGLGMHAYFPGRLAPMMLVFFGGILFLRRRAFGLPKRLFAGAALGCLLMASPVIIYALRDSRYNVYVDQASVVKNTGAKGWWDVKTYGPMLREQAKTYLKMFHLGLNHEADGQEDDLVRTPVLDPVMQVLAPLGLALALLGILRGGSAYILVGFLVGILPAAVSMLGPPPWPRRAIFSFPFCYLAAGLALEHVRLGLTRGRLRIPNWLFGLALAVLAYDVGQKMLKHFELYANSPGMKQFANARTYHASKHLRKHPDANVIASTDFVRPLSSTLLFPKDRAMRGGVNFAEHLFLAPERDNLLLLGGWAESAVPLLKELYPNATVDIYRDERVATDEGFVKYQETIYDEFCYPGTLLVAVFIPKADAAARFSLLDLAKGAPVPGSLGAQGLHALQALGPGQQRLGASVWMDTQGGTLTANVGLPGWSARLDGAPLALGKPKWVTGGMRFLELSGPLKAGGHGPFPLTLQMRGEDLLAARRVIGYRFTRSYKVQLYDGDEGGHILPGRAPHTTYTGVCPTLRFTESSGGSCIFVAAITGHLRPDLSGRMELRAHWPSSSACMVWLGKDLVCDRREPGHGPRGTVFPVELKAGQARPYRVEYYSRCMTENFQGFSWEMRRPGESAWQMVPWTWFEP